MCLLRLGIHLAYRDTGARCLPSVYQVSTRVVGSNNALLTISTINPERSRSTVLYLYLCMHNVEHSIKITYPMKMKCRLPGPALCRALSHRRSDGVGARHLPHAYMSSFSLTRVVGLKKCPLAATTTTRPSSGCCYQAYYGERSNALRSVCHDSSARELLCDQSSCLATTVLHHGCLGR